MIASDLSMPEADLTRLLGGNHADPHRVLGAHPATRDGITGVVIRTRHPDAVAADIVLPDGECAALEPLGRGGVFAGFVAARTLPLAYRLRFRFPDGNVFERGDPYRFLPTLGETDLHLMGEGTHRRLWTRLGARSLTHDGCDGVAFAVWAPTARRVSVVGDFCAWDGRIYPMRQLGSSGVFELFVPDLASGTQYKFEIKTARGALRVKTDPLARAMELPPGTASVIVGPETYVWGDGDWMARRPGRDWRREPMAAYEVHLGSWARVPEEGNRALTYRELAPRLVEHATRFGFTHVQFLPVSEHPFTGSWGYQVSGYYAPTARYGTPDDLRFLIDACHQAGIGVILDWVPAHFPKDDFALAQFDGTALYEHADPRAGEHPDWGTLIFNYGRTEVCNFLVANALYWLEAFHVDGLRVDAVASMLYLDYSRQPGEWIPNRYGGRENLDAIDFFRDLHRVLAAEAPGTFTVAEESTAWPGVTRPVELGGLGFTFKWNMGWMHDTLEYFKKEPIHRQYHHDQLTFAALYEFDERFVMPLSHDEVVHGKGSLLSKMPGDPWQQFANLRLLYTYMFTRPGKQLLFMGAELASPGEWDHDGSLDWHLATDPPRAGLGRLLEALGALYRATPCLWRTDPDREGFAWIDCNDRDNSVVSYLRRDGEDLVVVVLNLTPVPRNDYRIGVPAVGRYGVLLSSDAAEFGGSGYAIPEVLAAEPVPFHGHAQSLCLQLPPLGGLVLTPRA